MKKILGKNFLEKFFMILVLGLWSVLTVSMHAEATPANISPEIKLSVLSMPFIENKGQVENASVKYYANTLIGTVFVTNEGFTYSLSSGTNTAVIKEAIFGMPTGITTSETRANYFKDNNKEVRKCRQ